MRIIFINRFFSPDHSATSQLVSDLAFFLAGRGHAVAAITSRLRYDGPDASLKPCERVRGVEVHRVWSSRFGRSFLPGRAIDYLTFYLSTAWRLWRVARAGDVIVAKTDPPLVSVAGGWVAGRRGARLVNWVQDLFPEVAVALGIGMNRGPLTNLLARARDASLRKAVANVAIGEGMRRRLLGLGADEGRVHVIHNWSDDERIRPLPAEPNPLRTEWGLEHRFVVGYSGNLGRAHEHGTLLAAAEALRGERDIVFLFIGGGTCMERLRVEAGARGLSNLIFRPYQPVERLGESLAVPDVHLVVLRPEMEGLVVPSKFYGIAAAGRPAVYVGDRAGEIAALLTEGQAGLVVAQGDGEALAGAILGLRGDAALRERMGRNARALCVARFSRRAALEQWEALLEAVAAPSRDRF
jgi:glycosyltransferase involved in cell wall biosynthesis